MMSEDVCFLPQKEESKSGCGQPCLEWECVEADFERGAGMDAPVSSAELDAGPLKNAVIDSDGALIEGGGITAQKIKKNKKKKRKKLPQIALIKNSVKNTKKIGKKYFKNSAQATFRVRGNLDQEMRQTYDKGKNLGESITKNYENIEYGKHTKKDCSPEKERAGRICTAVDFERARDEKILDPPGFFCVNPFVKEGGSPDQLKKSGKNLKKIKKNDLINKNLDKNIVLKSSIKMNSEERCEVIVDALCGEVEAQDDVSPPNRKTARQGFGYAEVAVRKSKREREAALLELNKALAQAAKREKELAEEQEERREKAKNIMHQRRNVEYAIASLQEKADKWQKISQEAYFEAVCCWSLEFSGNSKTFLGIPLSKMYYGASLAALRYCAEYQKDLAIEREKLSQKDRELMRLLERS